MNRLTLLTLGILLTVVFSLTGLVLVPQMQLQQLKQYEDDDKNLWPIKWEGSLGEGREAYVDLGCMYCHSQQIRPQKYGSDIDRGWGSRRTVPRDYLFDKPHQLGTMRTGPDLFNIGERQPSRQWQMLHLYNPQLTSKGSIMPPFPFLFRELKQDEPRPSNAVKVPAAEGKPAHWVVPKDKAEDLVDYLLALKHNYELPEAH